MTFVGRFHEVRAGSPAAVGAAVTAVRARLTHSLPLAIIAFGVVLTVVWTAGLFWLLVLLLLGLV